MPHFDDEKRKSERQRILEEKVRTAFPNAKINVIPVGDFDWGLRIEDSSSRATVIFVPSEPLMTDVGNNFERYFESGIDEAKRILHKNSNKTIRIHLTTDRGLWQE